jgi:hypothetical protein
VDAPIRWVAVPGVEIVTALRQADGSLRGFAKIVRDVSARRAADDGRLHFQTLFESAPGLYLVLRPDTFEVVAASDAYLRAMLAIAHRYVEMLGGTISVDSTLGQGTRFLVRLPPD